MSTNFHVEVERVVMARIAAGTLALPVLPLAATRALTLLRNPDVSPRMLASVLDRDPMIVVQVLRAANAASHGATGVATIEQALTRLGTNRMRTVLIETCARRLFQSRDARIRTACDGLWEHSVAVAIFARDLAALGSGDAESAYVVGLLHDVAKPVVAAYLLETERVAASRNLRWISADDWLDVVRTVSPSLSAAIAERWELSAPIVSAIRALDDYDPTNRHCVANTVRLASAALRQAALPAGTEESDAVSAMVMLGRSLLGLDESVVQRMMADVTDRARKRVTKSVPPGPGRANAPPRA